MKLKRFMLRRCAHCSKGCEHWVVGLGFSNNLNQGL